MDPSDPVLAEVVRDGWVESVHRGRLAVVDAAGEVLDARGAVDEPVLLRSCAKPLQAAAMLRAGWEPSSSEAIAVACASHDGTDAHLEVVRAVLAAAGLDERALGNAVGFALEPDAAAYQRVTEGPDRIHHNCSGKHAAMLATCVARGWPLDGYLDVDHPLQVAITSTIQELTGATVAHVATDGCGAPIGAVPTTALARAYGRIVSEQPDVAEAMRAHPALVAGEARPPTRLMRAVPGLIAKDGAEGAFAVALPDGHAVAVKIDDGALRAAVVATAAALATMVDVDLSGLTSEVVEGGGRPVGVVRSTL